MRPGAAHPGLASPSDGDSGLESAGRSHPAPWPSGIKSCISSVWRSETAPADAPSGDIGGRRAPRWACMAWRSVCRRAADGRGDACWRWNEEGRLWREDAFSRPQLFGPASPHCDPPLLT